MISLSNYQTVSCSKKRRTTFRLMSMATRRAVSNLIYVRKLTVNNEKDSARRRWTHVSTTRGESCKFIPRNIATNCLVFPWEDYSSRRILRAIDKGSTSGGNLLISQRKNQMPYVYAFYHTKRADTLVIIVNHKDARER